MKHGTPIQWTHWRGFKGVTWNPMTGCTPISPGCDRCYAQASFKRFGKLWGYGPEPTTHLARIDQPLHWRKPRCVFVCSQGDLFHEHIPDRFIALVWLTMAQCPQHRFLVLTKRPARMRAVVEWCRRERSLMHDGSTFRDVPWPLPNVGLGVSVETPEYNHRIVNLLKTDAAIRFVSIEPMLAEADISPWLFESLGDVRARLDWVIAGGETQVGARPMKACWAHSLRNQCKHAGVPFFFKSMGTLANGRTKRPTPKGLRRPQFPVWGEEMK